MTCEVTDEADCVQKEDSSRDVAAGIYQWGQSQHSICSRSWASSTLQQVLLLLLMWAGVALGSYHSSGGYSPSRLSATANIPASEMNALYDLYNATNGEYWLWDTDPSAGIAWNFTDPTKNNPCVDHWQGIECTFTSPFEYYHVTNISLISYNLKGSIPESLSYLTLLQYLDLDTNLLAGTIPELFGNFIHLQYFDLDTNNLHGTIPESLGNLFQLQSLFLFSNQLTGTIPESLGHLTQLQYLGLSINLLTGTIPQSLGNLIQLQYFILDENLLTGSIPMSLDSLIKLEYLDFSTNKLTGSLPKSFGKLIYLEYFHLSYNFFTGIIPFMRANNLTVAELDHNFLSGSIPSFIKLRSLQVLLLHDNRLTGNLNGVFDPITQLQLVTIVVNNNQLTGTLPKAVFKLKLQTFVGSSNCFDKPLPISTICSNIDMVNFVADGMSSASSCRNKLFVGPISAYSLQHAIGGSIPTCLFQLPNITTLHLSGNGLTGSIPSGTVLSTTLTDLSLSHNALTGSIPEQIQLKQWDNIDLSYNRLSGTLSAIFSSNKTVELENNRVSGIIPASFRTLQNISVLGSNTFSCSYDESDLPQHDPNRRQYHCGSNSFDILFYLWIGVVASTAIVMAYCERKNYLSRIFRRYDDNTMQSTELYVTFSAVVWLSIKCVIYSILLLLPLYCICNIFYGTQTYKYAYHVSAVFMSGVVPFSLYWCFWIMLVFAVIVLVCPSPALICNHRLTQQSSWQNLLYICIPYLVIDLIVVAGANAAYVYVAVYKSSSLLLVVQTLLSIFKVVWGRWTLPYILSVLTRQKDCGVVNFTTQVTVNLLNNIIIPCLVVAVVSPNCFYNALVAAPTIISTVSYRVCISIILPSNICVLYGCISLPTSYDPPFTYNYQCSSSLITYYSPAFVSMCIVSTFMAPLMQYTCQWLHRRATVGTSWYRLLDTTLPGIMKPVRDTCDSKRRNLSSGGLMTTLIGTLGLILTFGVMFPPLSVALTVSLLATVFIFQVNVSRFISSAAQQHKKNVVEMLQQECNSGDAMQILKDSVWILVTVSCWFYTMFLFDTLGDAVGYEGAYWVLIVMPLMPLVMYIVYSVVYIFIVQQKSVDSSKVQGDGIEMKSTATGTGTEGDSIEVHNVLVVWNENNLTGNSAKVSAV